MHERAAGCASTQTAPSGGCACSKGGAHFLFLRHFFCLPPVRRRLCSESREMPARGTRAPVKPGTQQRATAPPVQLAHAQALPARAWATLLADAFARGSTANSAERADAGQRRGAISRWEQAHP